MTLNGVMAIILHYLTEIGSLLALGQLYHYIKVVEASHQRIMYKIWRNLTCHLGSAPRCNSDILYNL